MRSTTSRPECNHSSDPVTTRAIHHLRSMRISPVFPPIELSPPTELPQPRTVTLPSSPAFPLSSYLRVVPFLETSNIRPVNVQHNISPYRYAESWCSRGQRFRCSTNWLALSSPMPVAIDYERTFEVTDDHVSSSPSTSVQTVRGGPPIYRSIESIQTLAGHQMNADHDRVTLLVRAGTIAVR